MCDTPSVRRESRSVDEVGGHYRGSVKHTVPVVAKDGVVLRVHLQGDPAGPAVVQLSGGPGYVAYLADTEWCRPAFVITPEARGVGGSAGNAHDLAQAIADLEDVRNHLALDTWAVVGHSWGADLGLFYALAHPERVRVLVHVCGRGVQNDRDWSAAYHAAKDNDVSPAGDPFPYPYSTEVHAALLRSWRQWIKRPQLWREIAGCSARVIVVVAGDDIRPSWPNAQLAEALPCAEFVVVPDAHHDFWAAPGQAWCEQVQRRAVEVQADRPSGP